MSFSIDSMGRTITRRQFASGLAALLAAPSLALGRPIGFGVFSLFEPREVLLSAEQPLLVLGGDRRFTVSPGDTPVCLRSEGAGLRVLFGNASFTASRLRAASPAGGPAGLVLAVPPTAEHGGIRRGFQGSFEITAAAGRLRPVVSMEMETAVASIVAAESPANAPPAFLMAQATASRSFLLAARPAHSGFDFCDTTHCQFLRGPASAGSPASIAAARTAGLRLHYEDQPLAAMYSRSCSGRTSSLDELGLPVRGYPYYSVECQFCLRHPEAWVRELADGANAPHGERGRIAFGRVHGWAALPSSSFTRHGSRLEGRGMGHGLGLCQRGAIAMAAAGGGFDSILAHYYPNTRIAAAAPPPIF